MGASSCAALLFTLGCETPAPPAPTPPQVTIALPVTRDVAKYDDFSGTLQESELLEVRARVQGFLQPAGFKEGDTVEAGQVLFTIEPEPFQAKLAAAQAVLGQTDARIQLAEANLARAEQLVRTNAMTREEYQTRLAERNVYVAARAGDVAAVEQAQIELSYTTIKAPFQGVAGRVRVDPGNLVGAGEPTLLTTIRKMDPIYVYFDASAKLLQRVLQRRLDRGARDSVPVMLKLTGETKYGHEGIVNFLDNTVDPSTGTVLVRGEFKNDGLLYPGDFVRLRIRAEEAEPALLIQEDAIGTDLAGKFVLVVGSDNVVEQRIVTLGQQEGTMRVITDGLKADDRYIVRGIQKARPGKPVAPETQTATANNAQPAS
jgi:RND family efflux transporter MFP subunit